MADDILFVATIKRGTSRHGTESYVVCPYVDGDVLFRMTLLEASRVTSIRPEFETERGISGVWKFVKPPLNHSTPFIQLVETESLGALKVPEWLS